MCVCTVCSGTEVPACMKDPDKKGRSTGRSSPASIQTEAKTSCLGSKLAGGGVLDLSGEKGFLVEEARPHRTPLSSPCLSGEPRKGVWGVEPG